MQNTQETTPSPYASSRAAEEQKYVLFGLAGETYGLPVLHLQEIIAKYQLTVLPNLPEFFHGVLGLRGDVIPILNLRRRFGFVDGAPDRRNRIIIVDTKPAPVGIQVDEVFRVGTIKRDEIESPPELTCGKTDRYVAGVSGQDSGRLVIHLDMHEVLGSVEKIELANLTDSIRQAYRQAAAGSEAELDEGQTETLDENTDETLETDHDSTLDQDNSANREQES